LAGGLPPLPLHTHVMLSPFFIVFDLEHSTVTVGVTECNDTKIYYRK
jgi:hypothetical protein